jgi:oxygen-independent coproporphyrinogen-3 oxidase
MAVGLYVHVPFCRTRCHFCAFYLQIHREDRVRDYLSSLEGEMRLHTARAGLRRRPLDTVYFGGGTPTTLSPDCLGQVLATIRAVFGLADTPEVTVEAHPDTVSVEGLARLVEAGFTRINLGIQGMAEAELIGVGRRPGRRPAGFAVEAAREAGFTVLGADLMYGLPGQSLETWTATLTEVLAWEPDHLSCYALTLEEHTHLAIEVERGAVPRPDPGLQSEMEDAAAQLLAAAGFEQYEISNYCRPGNRCRHNLLYWSGEDYLGLGPSAQSYLDGIRFGNVSDLNEYSRTIQAGRLPIVESERLTPEQRRREKIVFGLRLVEGVDRRILADAAGDDDWRHAFDRLTYEGLLEERAGKIRLTTRGRRIADSVAAALI